MAPRGKRAIPRPPAGGRPHGRLLAGEAGELVGVSGTTIGQWARRGYIRSSQGDGDPRVYSVEDVAEAAVVAALLERGVTHRWVRRAIDGLAERGRWPLSRAHLATAAGARATRVALTERGDVYLLTNRGWQLTAAAPELAPLEPSLRRRAGDGGF